MWHGILISNAFSKDFIGKLNVIGRKKSLIWILLKIQISDSDVERMAKNIQDNMNEKFYSHLYSDSGELIVIFKEKVMRTKSDKSTWKPIVEYGKSIGIPEKQLGFFPCRFEDEAY